MTNIYETKESVACIMTKKQSLREEIKGSGKASGVPDFTQVI